MALVQGTYFKICDLLKTSPVHNCFLFCHFPSAHRQHRCRNNRHSCMEKIVITAMQENRIHAAQIMPSAQK